MRVLVHWKKRQVLAAWATVAVSLTATRNRLGSARVIIVTTQRPALRS